MLGNSSIDRYHYNYRRAPEVSSGVHFAVRFTDPPRTHPLARSCGQELPVSRSNGWAALPYEEAAQKEAEVLRGSPAAARHAEVAMRGRVCQPKVRHPSFSSTR